MTAAEDHINEMGGSHALVVVAWQGQRQATARPSRAAPFLAQLIATRAQVPQTRLNRRAEPAEAVVCYRSVAGMMKRQAAQ
jgi:hypothetical protein